jgi:hypothetical protein
MILNFIQLKERLIIFGSTEGIVDRYQNSETLFYSKMDMSKFVVIY